MTRTTGSRYLRSWPFFTVSLAAAALAAVQLIAPGTSLAAAAGQRGRVTGTARRRAGLQRVQPHPASGQTRWHHLRRGTWRKPGEYGQLEDNGHYIGHDEPTVQFYSNQPGSSTNVTYVQTLPRDPRKLPTVHGPLKDTTHFFELMPALWYSMALCDPNSYPLLPCKPDSDTNSPHGSYLGGGSALLELQFYPPGFPPPWTASAVMALTGARR